MFEGKIAIVTGAASGIGKELARALAQRGTHVVLTDVDSQLLETTSQEIAGSTEHHTVDVTDAAAVEQVVRDTVAKHGRLDFIFNNAGIAIFGDARDMSLEDWNRLVDINIRGVIHGVAAAYPIMVAQGHGHILNTASASGLAPTPGGTGYSMTKHAVVGLSTSLRSEARRHGVRVSAICPGFIETPIFNNAKMLTKIDRQDAIDELRGAVHQPDALANAVMRGIERNKAHIVFTPFAHIGWRLYRFFPGLMERALDLTNRRNPLLPR